MGRDPPEGTVVTGPTEAVDLGREGLGEQEGVAVAELRRDRIDDVRQRLPVIANRRLHVSRGAPSAVA